MSGLRRLLCISSITLCIYLSICLSFIYTSICLSFSVSICPSQWYKQKLPRLHCIPTFIKFSMDTSLPQYTCRCCRLTVNRLSACLAPGIGKLELLQKLVFISVYHKNSSFTSGFSTVEITIAIARQIAEVTVVAAAAAAAQLVI